MNIMTMIVTKEQQKMLMEAIDFRITQLERKGNTEKNEKIKALVHEEAEQFNNLAKHIATMELFNEPQQSQQTQQPPIIQQNGDKNKSSK